MSKKVAVVMGSDSDLDTMRPCVKRLRSFGIETQVRIISAHRTPAAAEAPVSYTHLRAARPMRPGCSPTCRRALTS